MKESLGIRFSILSRTIKREMDHILQEQDLTGVQFMVLVHLREMEQGKVSEISQKRLEEAIHVTHPTMTELLKKLEKKGYVSTQTSETDRRAKCISSTGKAEELIATMDRVEEEVLAGIVQGLTEEQLRKIDEITAIMVNNVFERKRSEQQI